MTIRTTTHQSASAVLLALGALAAFTGCKGRTVVTGPAVDRPSFDGAAALQLAARQMEFGPRIPGQPGHAGQLQWMRSTLDTLADVVILDDFDAAVTSGDTLHLTNVIAKFRPDENRRIVLLTHWDTRPKSDEAKDSALQDQPVPGANDGASGTAVLMELARMFNEQQPPMGVDLLFVDGEDYGPGEKDMYLGARRYAATLPAKGQPGRPIYGVLLDMIGDRDLRIPVEGISAQYARPVVDKVWDTAARLGYASTFPKSGAREIGDDHIQLINAGVPTADLIDFDYGPDNAWWHTPDDTMDKLSASSLEKVGEVMAELVYSGG